MEIRNLRIEIKSDIDVSQPSKIIAYYDKVVDGDAITKMLELDSSEIDLSKTIAELWVEITNRIM